METSSHFGQSSWNCILALSQSKPSRSLISPSTATVMWEVFVMLKMTSLRKGCVIIRTADLHKAGNALVHSAFGNVYAEVQIPIVTNYHQIRIGNIPCTIQKLCMLELKTLLRWEKGWAHSPINWQAGVHELGYFVLIWAIMLKGVAVTFWLDLPQKNSTLKNLQCPPSQKDTEFKSWHYNCNCVLALWKSL